uniref:Uncharacterized protein n=1 Tax=viral metagenome TaxID=1070528 RepID=A0A6C0B7Q7_9ZZZZ
MILCFPEHRFRLYITRYLWSSVYIGEDLKPHPYGVLCFKSLPIPLH